MSTQTNNIKQRLYAKGGNMNIAQATTKKYKQLNIIQKLIKLAN